MDRFANALIRPTPTQDIAHRRVNIGISGMRILVQQDSRVHDLTGLAVTALGHMLFQPRLL